MNVSNDSTIIKEIGELEDLLMDGSPLKNPPKSTLKKSSANQNLKPKNTKSNQPKRRPPLLNQRHALDFDFEDISFLLQYIP